MYIPTPLCVAVRKLEMYSRRRGLALVCFNLLVFTLCQVNGEQSCAQGFQSWVTEDATGWMRRNRQFIVPSLNFSCDGVISSWNLTRSLERNVPVGNIIILQLWRQQTGPELTYTLQTEQTHTARTSNAASYVFTASPSMAVASGDVFGCYVPRSSGIRVANVTGMPMHTVFTSRLTARPMDFTAGDTGFNTSPLISINFTPFSTAPSSTEEIPVATTSRPENSGFNRTPLLSINFTPFSTLTSFTEELPVATTSRLEYTSNLASASISNIGSHSVSPTSIATAEKTTTSQFHSTSGPIPSFPSSTSVAGGGDTGDVSSPVAAIVGVVVAVIVTVVLISLVLVVATVVCWKIRGFKKYNIDTHSRHNGETAAVHDYTTLQPTYVNYTAHNGTCAVLDAPLHATNVIAVSGEYTEVPKFVATAATSNSLDESQVYEVPQSMAFGEHYECVTSHSPLTSSYLYVPTMEAREQKSTVLQNVNPIAEMENTYEETCFTTPEYENVQFAPPASEVEGLYGQLAERKCIEIPRQSVKSEQLLGSGQFGEVFKGTWMTPWGTKEVAIKSLAGKSSEEDKVKFLQEAAIMAQFRHPHIVRLLGAITVDEPNMIVLELLSKGDLLGYLVKQASNKQCAELPHQLLQFCREVADGMKYLSNKGFVHRDLAARNILLDGKLKCKIADFGLSRDIIDDTYYTSTAGKIPIKWTAPEALFFKKYSTGSDVWSYGMLMKEIWSLGEKPFPSLAPLECVTMLQGNPEYVQPPPPGCPKAIYQQMVLCWNSDHHGRPTFASLLETLSGPTHELLRIPEESLREVKNPEMAAQIGATGFFSLDLYLDLQKYYY